MRERANSSYPVCMPSPAVWCSGCCGTVRDGCCVCSVVFVVQRPCARKTGRSSQERRQGRNPVPFHLVTGGFVRPLCPGGVANYWGARCRRARVCRVRRGPIRSVRRNYSGGRGRRVLKNTALKHGSANHCVGAWTGQRKGSVGKNEVLTHWSGTGGRPERASVECSSLPGAEGDCTD